MKKKTILSFAAALTLGLGVAVGLHANEAKAAKAAGTTVYCKMTYNWWTQDGAAIGAYCWKGSDGTKNADWPGVRMTPVTGEDGLWTYAVPDAYDKVIFTRVNGSGTISDWGAKTADLNVPTDGKNMYEITSSSPSWGNPGVSGEWKTYSPVPPTPGAHVYKYSLNGAEGVLMTEGSSNEVVSEVLSFKTGDKVTFTKDDAAYAVNPKDADAYTKVEKVENELVFVQDYEGALYLNVSGAVLWAGELDRGYYLTGTFNEWTNYKHAIKASAHPEEEGTYVINDLKVTKDEEVQFINFVAEKKDPDWKGVDEAKLTIGDGVAAEKSGNNVKFTAEGTYNLYFNSTNGWYSINNPSYVPDIPEEDGYYLVGSKTDNKYAGAPKMLPGVENNAEYFAYEGKKDETIKVRMYEAERPEGADVWGFLVETEESQKVGTRSEAGDFVFSKDASIDVFAKWEFVPDEKEGHWQINFYVTEAANRYTVSVVNGLFDGKTMTDTQEGKSYIATEGTTFDPEDPELENYVFRGFYTDEEFKNAYVPTLPTENFTLYAKFTRICYYLFGDATFMGEGHAWDIDAASPVSAGEGQDRLVGTAVIPTSASEQSPVCIKPLLWNGAMQPETYTLGEERTFVHLDDNGNFAFTEGGNYAFYVNQQNQVYFNIGEYVFHAKFLNEVGDVCKADGSTNKSQLKAVWADMAKAYNALSDNDKQNIIKVGFDGGDEHSEDARLRMIAKYAYIVTKYGTAEFEDFIWSQNIAPKPAYNNVVEFSEENNSLMIMIVVISAATIAGASVLLILKKKRHSK